MTLVHRSGGTARAYSQGAHLTSWVPAGSREALFMGATAEIAEGKAIRGGVPVVFPQFAKNGPLPQHGFVRRTPWQVHEVRDSSAAFRITDDGETRALWPHAFAATLAVRVTERSLRIELTVTNTDASPISFTCALHTYLRVGDLARARITGLGGRRFLDKTAGGAESVQREEALAIAAEVDRIYLDPPSSVTLHDDAEARRIQVQSSGFANVVVWNPGRERVTEFSGLSADDYLRFVCIEPATAVDPIVLPPTETWTGSQELIVAA